MKKFFVILAVMGFAAIYAQNVSAQEADEQNAEATEEVAEAPAALDANSLLSGSGEEVPFHQALKTKFIEGGPAFMSLIILCLVLGLAISIERILYLGLSKTNTKKLIEKIEKGLAEGGIEKAKEICRNTRGPVASIFYQGLLHYDQGVEAVEKNVVSYGSVQMSQMESGLSWISLFIAVAPSLGFMGTVIGMINAFDAIQAAGDISPNVVAGGMKVALITTVGGLIVGIILQFFYNYILSQIDGITVSMEDASIDLIDVLVKYENKK